MESRYVYSPSSSRRWPIVRERNDYGIENDDPTIWYVTSAYFAALGDFRPHDDDGQERPYDATVEEGWWFCLPVDESTSSAFRVILNTSLNDEEETCFAMGHWPLLRVPCGALMIGECPFGVCQLDEENGRDIISVHHHDRIAVVLVPPGNYAVTILQYLRGPEFCFHLMPRNDEPPCPMSVALELHESVPLELQNRVVGAWQTVRAGAVRPAYLCGSNAVATSMWGLSFLESVFDCRTAMPRLRIRLS